MNDSSQRVSPENEMGKTKDAHTSCCLAPRVTRRNRQSHELQKGEDTDHLHLNVRQRDVLPKDTILVARLNRVVKNVDEQTSMSRYVRTT